MSKAEDSNSGEELEEGTLLSHLIELRRRLLGAVDSVLPLLLLLHELHDFGRLRRGRVRVHREVRSEVRTPTARWLFARGEPSFGLLVTAFGGRFVIKANQLPDTASFSPPF